MFGAETETQEKNIISTVEYSGESVLFLEVLRHCLRSDSLMDSTEFEATLADNLVSSARTLRYGWGWIFQRMDSDLKHNTIKWFWDRQVMQ